MQCLDCFNVVFMQNSMGDPMVSTATPMHTIVNPPVVTIPHGMMPMSYMQECAPSTMSPQHSSPPPPVYSPPQQTPGSPHGAYGSPYPGSPSQQASGMQQQHCMMEELSSPLHHGTMIETYVDRSPSRSPIQQHKFHAATQGLYTSSHQVIRI